LFGTWLHCSPDPRNGGLSILESAEGPYSWQAIPGLDQALHGPLIENSSKLLLACECHGIALAACRRIVDLTHDLCIAGEVKKHFR
jgi:hypothetical protein